MVLYGKVKDKKFFFIVILKLMLLTLFSSEYSTNLFFPFLNSFAEGHLNPWQYYYANNFNLDSFPYHSLMLVILYPFTLISDILNTNFFFRIPLLIADIGILFILLKLFPKKTKAIYIFYFLNPIIIYSTYIHSQLDIIPTALLMYSVYLLISKKYVSSSIIFGFALATKIHIIIALPLILFYLYKITNKKICIYFLIISLSVFLLLDSPFIFSDGFIKMVLMNHKQSLLFNSFYKIGEAKLLLPIAVILSVYLHFFNQNKVNNDLLFFYFGILFTLTICFIYPSPAWYVWMIPFVTIYFIQNENKNKTLLLHIIFSISYLIFFILFHNSEYKDILFLGDTVNLKIKNNDFSNVSFTSLEVTLLAIMYSFYNYGVKSNSIYKKQTNLVIGIGGDSGVGKTTILHKLETVLGRDGELLRIEGDGEHKWERGDKNWDCLTHLNPKANHIHKQADAIFELKHNKVIYRSEYDHVTGRFTQPLKLTPKKFIIIAGLHPFYLPKLRKIIDFKIYIDTDENLRIHWKIIRDTKKRNYNKENILKQINSRASDTDKYIYPQKKFADMIIKYFPTNKFELGNEKENIELGLKITFDANIHIETILTKLDCDFTWDYNNDLKSQFIELKKSPKIEFKNIAENVIENINEIVPNEAKWNYGYDGLIQLLSIKMISEKLKEEGNN